MLVLPALSFAVIVKPFNFPVFTNWPSDLTYFPPLLFIDTGPDRTPEPVQFNFTLATPPASVTLTEKLNDVGEQLPLVL